MRPCHASGKYSQRKADHHRRDTWESDYWQPRTIPPPLRNTQGRASYHSKPNDESRPAHEHLSLRRNIRRPQDVVKLTTRGRGLGKVSYRPPCTRYSGNEENYTEADRSIDVPVSPGSSHAPAGQLSGSALAASAKSTTPG